MFDDNHYEKNLLYVYTRGVNAIGFFIFFVMILYMFVYLMFEECVRAGEDMNTLIWSLLSLYCQRQ